MHLAAFDKCVLQVQNSRQYWIIQIFRAVALLWEMDESTISISSFSHQVGIPKICNWISCFFYNALGA